MRDLAKKLQQMKEVHGQRAYRVMYTLPNQWNIKAVICASEDCDKSHLWQVVSKNTSVFFKTLRDAQNYCKRCGWL